MSDHNERPSAPEAGRAGCELVLLLILFVLGLLLFAPAMNAIAPLEQLNNNTQVKQLGR